MSSFCHADFSLSGDDSRPGHSSYVERIGGGRDTHLYKTRAIRYLRRDLVSRIVKDSTLWEMGGSIFERVVLGAVIGVRIRLSKPFQIKDNEEICSY